MDLKKALFLNEVDHRELLIVMAAHFGVLSMGSESNWTLGEPAQLDLHLTKKGKIDGITPAATFGTAQANELSARIKKEILDGHEGVSSAILFSRQPLNGAYRYRDQFQFLPLPPNASRSIQNSPAAVHPFLLEFSYKSSTNGMVNQARQRNCAMRIFRLLNQCLRPSLRIEEASSSQEWVGVQRGEELKTELVSKGYTWPKSVSYSDISSFGGIPVEQDHAYYDDLSTKNEPLSIPASLTELLDRFFRLSGEDQDRFYRAASWFSIAQETRSVSVSSAYVALVSAIENLKGESRPCPECGQSQEIGVGTCSKCSLPTYRVTAAFKAFLEDYYPAIKDSPSKVPGLFYGIRSELVHGARLLGADLDPGFLIKGPLEESERQTYLHLFNIAKLASLNWLRQREERLAMTKP